VNGLNPQGQVAGWYTTTSGSRRSFVWRAGAFVDFVIPGATTTCAFGISANGWVVGSYVNPDGSEHGFLVKG
jgi:uncharacterized membrane protein